MKTMISNRWRKRFDVGGAFILSSIALLSQSQLPIDNIGNASPSSLSNIVISYGPYNEVATALGSRLLAPGNERLILTGTLSRRGVPTALRVITQFPAAFRIEQAGPGGKVIISSDGTRVQVPNPSTRDDDESIAESLVQDSAEGFLAALGSGAPSRYIGSRFRVDDGKTKDYSGPFLDIHEIQATLAFRSDRAIRSKMYMFDSTDRLLRRVAYDEPVQGKKSRRVEIFLDEWRTVRGHKIVGSISRKEDGIEVWRFSVTEAATAPKQNDGLF